MNVLGCFSIFRKEKQFYKGLYTSNMIIKYFHSILGVYSEETALNCVEN